MFRLASPQNTPRATPQTGNITPLGLPYHGMNTRAAYAAMPPEFGISLINVTAESYGLRTRKGYTEWATNIPGSVPVPTLMAYYPAPDAPVLAARRNIDKTLPFLRQLFTSQLSRLRPRMPGALSVTPPGKLFAAKNGSIWNVTAGGTGPWTAESGISGTSDYWTGLNFANTAGDWLVCTNDEGGYYTYDGTTWVHVTMGTGTNQVSGIDPAKFVYVTLWKHRLWFIEKGTTHAWYLGTDSLYGAASEFDFGPQFPHGGALQQLCSWTVDPGSGTDALLVAVSTEGDIVIYQGTDPTDATNFGIKGTWYAGPLPFGRRSVNSDGGEVYVLTMFGAWPLSKLLSQSSLAALAVQRLSYPVDSLLTRLMQSFSDLPGWQIRTLAKEGMIIIGVPSDATTDGGDFFAYRTASDSWSMLQDTGYMCFAPVDGDIFAGTKDGRVVLAFNGTLDNVLIGAVSGDPIQCQVTPAYQAMGDDGFVKRFSLVRPSFIASATPKLTLQILTDYSSIQPVIAPTLPIITQSLWNTAIWDQSLWSGLQAPIRQWLGAHGRGFTATVQLDYLCGGDTLLMSIDFWSEQGGVR